MSRFFVATVYYKQGSSLKLIVLKNRPDPLILEDVPEKVYSSELKPIVGMYLALANFEITNQGSRSIY